MDLRHAQPVRGHRQLQGQVCLVAHVVDDVRDELGPQQLRRSTCELNDRDRRWDPMAAEMAISAASFVAVTR
jgi:hypothetical protein